MELQIAAAVGAILTVVLQIVKALPKHWVVKILGSTKDMRAARMQVFTGVVAVATSVVYVAMEGGTPVESVESFFAVAGTVVAVSYAAYMGAVKRLGDKMDIFKV